MTKKEKKILEENFFLILCCFIVPIVILYSEGVSLLIEIGATILIIAHVLGIAWARRYNSN